MIKIKKVENNEHKEVRGYRSSDSTLGTNSIQTRIKVEKNYKFTEEEMFESPKGFCFGKSFIQPIEKFKAYLNFESKLTKNYNVSINGGSGVGKTRLAKFLIRYFHLQNKHQYVIDVQGDMKVEGEKLYKFTRNSNTMGFNYFTMTKDLDNGGPLANVDLIYELFKNSVMGEAGPIQKAVFKEAVVQCYRSKGILAEDPNTWDNELPTPKYFEKFILKIMGESGQSASILACSSQEVIKIKQLIKREGETEKLQKKLDAAIEKYQQDHAMFMEYSQSNEYERIFEGLELNEDYVDLTTFYMGNNFRSLQTLYTYIKTMADSSLFGDKPFPELDGLIRFDVSGFTSYGKPEEAIFFINYVFANYFRAIKERGEYRDISDEYKQKHGKYMDALCWVDEGKLVLPEGNKKENPYHIINRIITESRKYGGGMGLMSQRITHYSGELINSIYTKILLQSEDVAKSIKALNMKVRENIDPKMLFDIQTNSKDGIAIIGTTGGLYDAIATPWYEPMENDVV